MKNRKLKFLNMVSSEPFIEDRILTNHEDFLEAIQFFRDQGKKIVYTLGAYDIKHIGHERYLNKAKECGDFLAVGIDSDEFITKSKGPTRPVVPFNERVEQVVNTRSVNIATILRTQEEADQLMKKMKPDVVVLSFSSAKEDFNQYEKRMKEKYGPYCSEVKILERQAVTSTTARLRLVVLDGAKNFVSAVRDYATKLINEVENFFKLHGGTES